MYPRPIHRWKSFWFGLLVLAFFGWAWEDSMERYSGVSWGSAASCKVARIRHVNGFIAVGIGDHTLPPGAMAGFRTNRLKSARGSQNFARPHISRDPFGVLFIVVPHWLLALLFFLPWAGWLVWRKRLRKAGGAEFISIG